MRIAIIVALIVSSIVNCRADTQFKSSEKEIMDKHFEMFTQKGRDQIDNTDHIAPDLQRIRVANIDKFWQAYKPWLKCMDRLPAHSKSTVCEHFAPGWVTPLDELVQLDKTIHQKVANGN